MRTQRIVTVMTLSFSCTLAAVSIGAAPV